MKKKSAIKKGNDASQWWNEHLKEYREANPFRRKNEAGKTEWEAIFNSFSITPKTHLKLVDFGSGTGRFALQFLKKGFAVTGIDVSDIAIRILKRRAQKYKLSKKLRVVQSGLYVPIKKLEASFDGGYMIVTYHCISNKQKEQKRVFKNFVKLIKKNGKILIMEPNPFNPLFYIFYLFVYKGNVQEGYNIINSKKHILTNLLKETGLEVTDVYYHSFLPTYFINYWSYVKKINRFLCSIPGIRNFSAFHIITAVKK